MSNYAKIIVGTMAKGKDIMLKIAVIDDEEYYSELIRQTVCNWLMEKGCQGEIDCFDYFEKKIAATKKKSKNRYTGIEVLNLMLNYEIEQAEEKAIRVKCAVEAYLCPVDETELCIIIGNLFDNAIEAVKDLPDEQRQIDFVIQNPNGIFRIEISNPYEGERRKIEHHYLTTKKENTEMHGLGLMSVQKIVEKYDGLIEINDVDSLFKVDVTFYDEEV